MADWSVCCYSNAGPFFIADILTEAHITDDFNNTKALTPMSSIGSPASLTQGPSAGVSPAGGGRGSERLPVAEEVISPTLFKSLTPDPHFSPGHCGLSSAQLSSEQSSPSAGSICALIGRWQRLGRALAWTRPACVSRRLSIEPAHVSRVASCVCVCVLPN